MKGEFVFFLGKQGCGKSSLLKALVGSMYVVEDQKTELVVNGKISYMPQNNFFIEGTLLDNILFFSEKNDDLLLDIIKNCDLEKVVEKFDKGLLEKYEDVKSMLT